jgi:hypothetical protein
MKLWVFGDSNSLPQWLDDHSLGWPTLLSKKLNCELISYAQAGVDNFFIYQSILQSINDIAPTDCVVIGWTHPNRKVFVLNRHNSEHTGALSQSMVYQDHGQEFFRSNGPERSNLKKVLSFRPDDSGIRFFDRWFGDYHHEYEQQITFQAYVDSISIRLPNSIQFYFSQQSISGIEIGKPEPLCILDFILENQYNLTETDYHANPKGHHVWSELLYEIIQKEK